MKFIAIVAVLAQLAVSSPSGSDKEQSSQSSSSVSSRRPYESDTFELGSTTLGDSRYPVKIQEVDTENENKVKQNLKPLAISNLFRFFSILFTTKFKGYGEGNWLSDEETKQFLANEKELIRILEQAGANKESDSVVNELTVDPALAAKYETMFEKLCSVYCTNVQCKLINEGDGDYSGSFLKEILVYVKDLESLTEEQAQFVLAHEIAHVTLKHPFSQRLLFAKKYKGAFASVTRAAAILALLIYMISGSTTALRNFQITFLVACALLARGGLLIHEKKTSEAKYEREYEADLLALDILENVNVDLQKAISFFDLMSDPIVRSVLILLHL